MKRFLVLFFIAGFFALVSISRAAYRGEKRDRAEVALGEKLFFDKILSRDRSISCASCHKPEFAFADNVPLSFGVDSLKGLRNAPTIMNLDGHEPFFHDGRAATLEEQVTGPIMNPLEMDMSIDSAVSRLNHNAEYQKLFRKIYRSAVTKENFCAAIAAYERSLFTAHTPFDRFMQGDSNAISASAKRGRELFHDKGHCFDCHRGTDFTKDEFRNIGLFNERDWNDEGRYEVTHDSSDRGKFRVPSLRNISVTAPYMHNGGFRSLSEVIDYYDDPTRFVKHAVGTDTLIKPLHLSGQEKKDLEAFLETLTDDRFVKKP